MTLPSDFGADDGWQSLDPTQITLNRILGWILVWIVGAAAVVGLFILWLTESISPLQLGSLCLLTFVLWAGLAAWAHVWPRIEHRHCRYRASSHGLEIQRGVWWRSQIAVPSSRIQHTDVRQGPLQRRLGLGTLVVFTAGTEHAAIELSGLPYARALGVRELLSVQREEDATT